MSSLLFFSLSTSSALLPLVLSPSSLHFATSSSFFRSSRLALDASFVLVRFVLSCRIRILISQAQRSTALLYALHLGLGSPRLGGGDCFGRSWEFASCPLIPRHRLRLVHARSSRAEDPVIFLFACRRFAGLCYARDREWKQKGNEAEGEIASIMTAGPR